MASEDIAVRFVNLGSGHIHAPTTLPRVRSPWYPLTVRLFWTHIRTARVSEKNLLPSTQSENLNRLDPLKGEAFGAPILQQTMMACIAEVWTELNSVKMNSETL